MNINAIIIETINEYFDKNLMTPLYNKLGRGKKDLSNRKDTLRFVNEPRISKNRWYIHGNYSINNIASIIKNGFTGGIGLDSLEYAFWSYDEEAPHDYTHKDNLIFGFPIETAIYNDDIATGYGDCLLMYQGNGIDYYHNAYVREVEEVVCNARHIKNKIIIANIRGESISGNYNNKEKLFAVGDINGKPIYTNSDLGEVCKWVLNNYKQYSRYLIDVIPTYMLSKEAVDKLPQYDLLDSNDDQKLQKINVIDRLKEINGTYKIEEYFELYKETDNDYVTVVKSLDDGYLYFCYNNDLILCNGKIRFTDDDFYEFIYYLDYIVLRTDNGYTLINIDENTYLGYPNDIVWCDYIWEDFTCRINEKYYNIDKDDLSLELDEDEESDEDE